MNPGQRLEVDVIGLPTTQGSKRLIQPYRADGARGRAVMVEQGGRALASWRDSVSTAAAREAYANGWPKACGAIALSIVFRLRAPIPIAKLIERDPSIGRHVITNPDVDKLCRAVMDALTTAGIYDDDRRVCRLVADKIYAGSGGEAASLGARIEIVRLA